MAEIGEDYSRYLADITWSYWRDVGAKPKMTWIELKHIAELFVEECKKRGIDPEAINFRDEVAEAGLTYEEQKKKVLEVLNRIAEAPPDVLETALEEAIRAVEAAGKKVVEAKTLEEALEAKERLERAERRIKALKMEIEAKERKIAELERKLEEERTKAKTIKIKFLTDVPPWYRAGQVVETGDIDWALRLIDEAKAVRVEAAPPVPAKPLEETVKEVIEQMRRFIE